MMSSSPPYDKNKHTFSADLFGITDARGQLSSPVPPPPNDQDPRQTYDPSMYHHPSLASPFGGNSSTMMPSVSNNTLLSSPHNEISNASTPLTSVHDERYSHHTTPSFDNDYPFIGEVNDLSFDNMADDTQLPPNSTGQFHRTTTSSSRGTQLPSPSITATPSPLIQTKDLKDAPQTPNNLARPQNGYANNNITSPSFHIEDHDAAPARTRMRTGPSNANLNYVQPAGAFDDTSSREAPNEDEVLSLQDLERIAQEKQQRALVETWLTRGSVSDGSSVLGESGRLSSNEMLGIAGHNRERSKSVGDWRNTQPPLLDTTFNNMSMQAQEPTEYPFEDTGARTPGDVLHDDATDEEGTSDMSEDETEDQMDVIAEANEDDHPFPMLHEQPSFPLDPEVIDIIPFEKTRRAETGIDPLQPDAEIPGTANYPRPSSFYSNKARYWDDYTGQYRNVTNTSQQSQPLTSQAAIYRFKRANENIETASRVATFDSIATTRTRRLSAGDVEGLPAIFKRLSFGKDREALSIARHVDRKPSKFEPINQVRGALKRFSSASSDQKPGIVHRGSSSSNVSTVGRTTSNKDEPSRRDSGNNSAGPPNRIHSSLKRKLSKKKNKDQVKVDTKSAFASMGKGLMSVGGGESGSTVAPILPNLPGALPTRHSSFGSPLGRQDVKFGVASLPSTPARHQSAGSLSVPRHHDDDAEGEIDDTIAEESITVTKPTRVAPPAPAPLQVIERVTVANKAGFSRNCSQMFPRLAPELNGRIALEQVKKYKRLLELRLKHEEAVRLHGHCENKEKCAAVTGQGRMQGASAANTAVPETPMVEDSDDEDGEDEEALDGRVSASQFPQGVPVPPVQRLPAEFECPICFKVRKFQKPSDWTKHVHEDVKPFTCTFEKCNEPTSFKRKADWVRHENEKHRQLEQWKCSIPDCQHVCARRDNFVQHLHREHKYPEVKVKATKSQGTSKTGKKAAAGKRSGGASEPSEEEADRVWKIVDDCHKHSAKESKEEPCRFCGERLPTWKKLTVHVARHMERISLPVLDLVGDDSVMSPSQRKGGGSSANASPVNQYPTNSFDTPSIDQTLAHSDMASQMSSLNMNYNAPHGLSPIHLQNMNMYISPEMLQQHNQSGSNHSSVSPVMHHDPTGTREIQALHQQMSAAFMPNHHHQQQQDPIMYGNPGVHTIDPQSNAAFQDALMHERFMLRNSPSQSMGLDYGYNGAGMGGQYGNGSMYSDLSGGNAGGLGYSLDTSVDDGTHGQYINYDGTLMTHQPPQQQQQY